MSTVSSPAASAASAMSGNTNPYDKMMRKEMAEKEEKDKAKPVQRDAQTIMAMGAMKFEAKVRHRT